MVWISAKRRWGVVGLLVVGSCLGLALRQSAHPTLPTVGIAVQQPVIMDPLQIPAKFHYSFGEGNAEIVYDDRSARGIRHMQLAFSSDGNREYAYATMPTGVMPSHGWPTIILAHGYINPRSYVSMGRAYRLYMDYFSAHGYMVIRPDYRGHGSSAGTAEGGYYSPGYTNDVLNLIASLKTLPIIDSRKLGIWGHSMGGYVALRAAVLNSQIKATVEVAGAVGDAPSLYSWKPDSIAAQPAASDTELRQVQRYGSPIENPGYWATTVPLSYVTRLSGPVQIHHGTADLQVPLVFSQQLDRSLTKAKVRHDFYEYEGANHSFLGAAGELMRSRSLQFFDEYVKASAGDDPKQ